MRRVDLIQSSFLLLPVSKRKYFHRMKITLNDLNVLTTEGRIQLFPCFSGSPGKTDTLEKKHHRILAMTGYVCTYSVYLCDLNTMQIQNAKAFKLQQIYVQYSLCYKLPPPQKVRYWSLDCLLQYFLTVNRYINVTELMMFTLSIKCLNLSNSPWLGKSGENTCHTEDFSTGNFNRFDFTIYLTIRRFTYQNWL